MFSKKLTKSATSLMKNKTFLYGVVAVSIATLIGVISFQNMQSMAVFAFSGLMGYYFTKNIVASFAVAVIVTNVLLAGETAYEAFSCKKRKEGFEDGEGEGESESQDGDDEKSEEKKEKKDTKGSDEEKQEVEGNDCPNGICVGDDEESFDIRPKRIDGKEDDVVIGKRVDYASTLEQAYDNLQNMIGKGGIENLTKDTQKLIAQQKSLMGTLTNIKPLIENAKETLNGVDMGNIGNIMKSLEGIKAIPK